MHCYGLPQDAKFKQIKVFGYLILISIDFYNFITAFSL